MAVFFNIAIVFLRNYLEVSENLPIFAGDINICFS